MITAQSPKLSFCTTCKERTHHLKKTLFKNIQSALSDTAKKDIEFIVLDYNSQDGLESWITNNKALRQYMDDGTLRYAKHDGPKFFHHAHAKNMAHRLATGNIVCNLDADNYIGSGFSQWILNKFEQKGRMIVQPSLNNILAFSSTYKQVPGFGGRVALLKNDFMRLGGYREDLHGSGGFGEDLDLVFRAEKSGFKLAEINDPHFLEFIQHSDEERFSQISQKNKNKAEHLVNATKSHWKTMKAAFVLASSSTDNSNRGFGVGVVSFPDEDQRTVVLEEHMEHSPYKTLPIASYINLLRSRLPFIENYCNLS